MRRRTLSRLGILAVIVAAVLLLRALPVGEWLRGAEQWVDARPVAGALIYLAATITSVVALTPGWIAMALGGLLFGFLPGLALGLVGITIGATAALVAGRTLARRWVERRIAGNERLLALDEAVQDQAFTIVFLTRIALVIPFNMLNYAYGVTRVNTAVYAAATAVGMLPVVALYSYVGSVATDVGAVLAGEASVDADVWWIAGIAVAAIAMVIFVVRRAVRRALEKRTRMGTTGETDDESPRRDDDGALTE
ncbi:MAG: TVP38/TMEM64 family protein [Woeseiaceae bacterium]|nr:TVP38/TMEM64 family protein [Woeseiaceae bacterium]